MTASVFQQAVFDDVQSGTGHTVVLARAGAGKTWTIMNALKLVPAGKTIGLFAFSAQDARELASRAPKGVEVKTLHSHGFSACRRAFGRDIKVDDAKSIKIATRIFGEPIDDHPVRSRYSALRDLVSKAKDVLCPKDDLDTLDELADRFGIDCPANDGERAAFIAACMTVMKASARETDTVDFSDMVWLPVARGLRVWAFDRVFVDETQDLSPAQIELLMMCVRPGGRITAVGDDRQAIYGFRGADAESIPNLIKRLDAKTLPLSITYRCCRAVTALAATEVPDFTPADGAPEGEITEGNLDSVLAGAMPGDMIISRANAPLMGICLKLLKSGKRATIKGRNVGDGIVRMIEKSKAKSVPKLIAWAQAWAKRETARLEKRKRPTNEVQDRFECLMALTEEAKGIGDVLARAESLFSDGPEAAPSIVLGTTHKMKGREADTVWMLTDTYRPNMGIEEANCWYVAVTRAKRKLHMVKTRAPAEKAATVAA